MRCDSQREIGLAFELRANRRNDSPPFQKFLVANNMIAPRLLLSSNFLVLVLGVLIIACSVKD